ncbi:Serine/threonine-protein phosphatase 4 regulatory subunit 2 [Eufriesea mexicana]|uniref:serine/threonine-protein phosphatase 4 regulatory subunit 2 n=1 Tax=Eufriesea mexicana TaxID=516756 RepID=UPI00083C161A|nr:PREDICTED: serine/threonine-protein phosphatase 4 regulatory subunit 2 [Eufriesea mexicana]OAD54817.1 Serine/threonine-protein phosphatase 4 regulatory subunit 2 [Eufriesea mexicana]
MDNLEEVLQALDEFQKMRPSEIPRELEDYLCWVAKTGDPVYQWSLIKTLFREKLTRVMTDFYETCPTLDLAPCPNVEHFNYDTMKSNLLERLESFASAPFTVQRICELLTAPRKEYNRVDKFMRAIEKNILVVSTREPGPIARRNENGDGMVNGSIDEDTSVTQPPQDVEMEYWQKDCPSTVTISVHTVENETPLLHTVVPTTTVVKNVFGTEELSHEKVESTSSKSDIVVSNFIPTTSEFSGVSNLNSQTQTQDSQIGPTIQNLSTIVPETSGIMSDVSEAIMNEDTSSQPSLELENEGRDALDSLRKLQTTFQTKDFSSNENKSSKLYVDNSKINEKTEVETVSIHVQEGSNKSNDILIKSDVDLKTVLENKESVNPVIKNLLNTNENLETTIKLGTDVGNIQSIIDTSGSNTEHKEPLTLENVNIGSKVTTNSSEQPTNNLILSTDNVNTEETINTSEDMSVDVENIKDQNKEGELINDLKPIVEEPCSKDNATKNFNCDQEKSNLIITEAVEDETRVIKSIVPDPIPIVEEPKDTEIVNVKKNNSPIVEITEESENQNTTVTCQSENKKDMSVVDSNIAQLKGNDITSTINKIEDSDTVIENVMSKKGQEAVELMEVDEEETLSVFQQDDEPMEQETVQSSRS